MNTWIIGKDWMKQLPDKNYFYSESCLKGITDKDYTPAQKILLLCLMI